MRKSSSSDSDSVNDVFIEEIRFVDPNIMQQEQPKYTGAIPKSSSSALISPKVEHLPNNFQSVIEKINKGYRVAIILRGLPGSGKSFLSYQIVEQSVKTQPDDHIVSADKYFITNSGKYVFDKNKLDQAHADARNKFAQRASRGLSPLIVDNTNIQQWEMHVYLQIAAQYGYHVEIMEPATPWKSTAAQLAKKNQHSVPEDKIKLMKSNFQPADVKSLMNNLNLKVVREPLMRNEPPLQGFELPLVEPRIIQSQSLLQFAPKNEIEDSTDSTMPNSSSSSSSQINPEIDSIQKQFEQIFNRGWDEPDPKPEEPQPPPQTQPQPQRKQKKTKSPTQKLVAHRKDCPNEDQKFAILRSMYPKCNDSYLWDYFVRCNGDAEWCVNLLCDENLVDQMQPGSDLTCCCFGSDVTKVEKAKKEAQPQPSPTVKSKKPKTESKQVNMDAWLETKEFIEKSIQIGQEHYPEHVREVKEWKNVRKPGMPEPGLPEEERLELSINKKLIIELDEEFGGGLLSSQLANGIKFPEKILIQKSTASQFYMEIMAAYYAQEEETRFKMLRDDEELAKMLNEEENQRVPKPVVNGNNVWVKDEEETEDIALKMSKDKLLELFPGIQTETLMEIFKGANYNFDETVALIEDSLMCTDEERKQIAASKKKVFNTPWKQESENTEKVVEDTAEDSGYTEAHLKTVENLRDDIAYHLEEMKICHQKAQEAIQKRSFEVASHFSNILNYHKTRKQEKEHEVGNLMAGIHQTYHQSNSLDLHYQTIVEAEILLNHFLDSQIERLRVTLQPYKELEIITGKGTHSANGIANIKIKAKSLLKRRRLNCIEVQENPGILKVKVYPNSLLSNEFDDP